MSSHRTLYHTSGLLLSLFSNRPGLAWLLRPFAPSRPPSVGLRPEFSAPSRSFSLTSALHRDASCKGSSSPLQPLTSLCSSPGDLLATLTRTYAPDQARLLANLSPLFAPFHVTTPFANQRRDRASTVVILAEALRIVKYPRWHIPGVGTNLPPPYSQIGWQIFEGSLCRPRKYIAP